MSKIRSSCQWIDLVSAGFLALLLAGALAGCSGGGSGGGSGPAVPPPSGGGATDLTITITSVAINSPPVVTFKVTDQAGAPVTNLAAADLRFNIAKLMPNSDGLPSTWQNYINRLSGGAVQGAQERTAAGYAFGTLANQGNGSYTYTFATDIKNPTAASCPAPCTDADGKPLDISYQAGLTHRVTIQQANSAYPPASGVYDFVPSGSGVVTRRDIVAAATCNSCHNELSAHGTRVDVRLCVTCHNPGSWVAGTPNITVDFKVMIHKIHYNNAGAALPSVVAGTPYIVNGTNFSAVTFPQDVRNCANCHSGTAGTNAVATAQGDNWKNQPNMGACGSCHDNVYFGAKPDPARPYQKQAHTGGVMSDSSTCVICHAAGRYTDNKDIVVAHNFPSRLEAAEAKFKYNIVSVAPTAAGSKPVITFSVTDPTNANKPYDIKTDPHFAQIASGASRLALSIGWNTTDFGNDASGASYGQPVSINILGNAAVVAGTAAGTYTVTSPVAVPAGQTGTLRVAMDGHPAGDVTTAGSYTDRLRVTNVYKDSGITGSVVARRTVVDIANCNVCHDVLSLHGNNRTNEPQVCALCHNPNATDAAQRPKNAAGGLSGGVDGKPEEAIDFKTMIHAIHAGQKSNGGFREKGLVIYGFGGSVNDFSKVVFPGKLNDCANCHAGTSYQLAGIWDAPTANGILGNTTSTSALPADAADNLRITPISAVCSSCHDSSVAKTHMQDAFNAGNFSATQAQINAGPPEACSFCHGAGKVLDVKLVHGVK